MARAHSRDTVIIINGSDLSVFCDDSTFGRKADKHDVTTYGKDDHVYDGGLGDGSASASGIYDTTAAGPSAVLKPLRGTVVPLIRRVEGTGAGKPQEAMSVLVEEYVETAPVAGFVAWSVTLQPSDAIIDSVQ